MFEWLQIYILWMNLFFHIVGPFVVLIILNYKVHTRFFDFATSNDQRSKKLGSLLLKDIKLNFLLQLAIANAWWNQDQGVWEDADRHPQGLLQQNDQPKSHFRSWN